jgi:hypothetical protein
MCASPFHNLIITIVHYFLVFVLTTIFNIQFIATLQMETVYSSETQPPDHRVIAYKNHKNQGKTIRDYEEFVSITDGPKYFDVNRYRESSRNTGNVQVYIRGMTPFR